MNVTTRIEELLNDTSDISQTELFETLTEAQARIAKLEAALRELVAHTNKHLYSGVHITREPLAMKQARAALQDTTP